MSNRLARSSSPYLRQHAHNPVDWYPWGSEALQRATREDKPILVSIGYSACHWCHVMEKESFEDPKVAAYMNEHFINIKVDREERPDLDHMFMDAVQAMTGQGGWPLNVFLTASGKPFYGGTYFPPKPLPGRVSWMELLSALHDTVERRRQEVEAQSAELVRYLQDFQKSALRTEPGGPRPFLPDTIQQIAQKALEQADRMYGGFGRAPKFPQTFLLQFLLRFFHVQGDAEAAQQACLSLEKMVRGGIFDQLGGGFARYSTDTRWLVPHFEKMLYDNALMVSTLSEAFQLSGIRSFEKAATATLSFLETDLASKDGGFFCALDADSEGEEGRYYVWDFSQVQQILGTRAPAFCQYFGVTPEGNWEGTNILHCSEDLETFAQARGWPFEIWEAELEQDRQQLLKNRRQRVAPGLDDKIILGWNALVVSAYCKAFAAFQNESYRNRAVATMGFLLSRGADPRKTAPAFLHLLHPGAPPIPAFADDYAQLIAALIDLQEVTGDIKYLLKARELTEWTIDQFGDESQRYFYFTPTNQGDTLFRKMDLHDGATPSANSLMAGNLHYLSIVFDKPDWKSRAEAMVEGCLPSILAHPGSFAQWATALTGLTYGLYEMAVVGQAPEALRSSLLQQFIPFRVLQSATSNDEAFPLLKQKAVGVDSQIYLCHHYHCQAPVSRVEDLVPLLETVHKF